MPRHTFEETELTLICLLKQGKPVDTKVTFVVMLDGVEKTRVDGAVTADKHARTGKAATAKYTPEAVAADKTHHVLTYKAIADKEEYPTDDEIHVWPKKGKLACKNEAGDKPFKGFKFKVMQNGEQFPKENGAYKATADNAEVEFKLDKGHTFALQGVEPFEIVGEPEKNGTALRDLKCKGKLNFEAEFVTPKRPVDGALKQWVNLAGEPAKKGTDGKGNEIEITLGVKGDRDDLGVAKAEIVGGPGVFVFVKVKFSGPGGKKSKRNTPKTDLVAGLNLSDRAAVKEAATDPEWEFTGKVELKETGGVGKFKINLGKAGGDTCQVSIGSTSACGNATLTFTNWRRIWYQIMAPDFMELEQRDLPDGSRAWDFAAAGRQNILNSGNATYIEYVMHQSYKFSEAEALVAIPGSVMKREFFNRSAGPAKVYLLTDHSFRSYPKNFDKTDAELIKRCTCVKACDENYYSDGPGTDDPIDLAWITTNAAPDFVFPAPADPAKKPTYWIPKSGFNGVDTIRSIHWWAEIANTAPYKVKPAVEFAADLHVDDDDDKEREFTIQETTQGKAAVQIVFTKPGRLRDVATDLDATAKGILNGLLTQLYSVPVLRANGNKLRFQVSGQTGTGRKATRFANIKQYIQDHVAANGPNTPIHPALKDDGSLHSGTLTWSNVVNMDRSMVTRISIDLPTANTTDPGSFVGALSATKCPVKVQIRFEPHHPANGLAGSGAQKGEILVKWGINCPLCITDTFLHELGHQYNMATVARGGGAHQWSTADATHAAGMRVPKTVVQDEDLAEYKFGANAKGHMYTGKGHSGPHCAFGLTDDQKTLGAYRSYRDGGGIIHAVNGTCTMFGSGPRDDGQRTRTSFCPQCIAYACGRDLAVLQ
ncbi:MAG: hypothetical protein SFZ23_13350 [Planctomycetota bacterium]|nr:hypothetical protein [Planctomycetota bacterium]